MISELRTVYRRRVRRRMCVRLGVHNGGTFFDERYGGQVFLCTHCKMQ